MVEETLLQLDLGTGASAVVILFIAYLLARTVTYGLTTISARAVERRITIKMLIPLLKTLIYGWAAWYVLVPILRLSSTQLLAVSGLLGAALGFGLKDLFANVIGGLVMIFERPYRVGDKVTLGDHYGEVMDIGIRSTKVLTPDDTLVSVPNYLSFSEAVANANAGNPEMMCVIEFYVDQDADIDRAKDIVEEAMLTSPYVYFSDAFPYTVIVDDKQHYRVLRGKAYVNDHRNEFEFRTDVTERVTDRFEDEGIGKPEFGGLED